MNIERPIKIINWKITFFIMVFINVIANPRSSGGSYNPEHSSRDNPVNIRCLIGNGLPAGRQGSPHSVESYSTSLAMTIS